MTDHKTLAAALAAFQADLPTIGKGETAKVEMKGGGSYSYSYADLADVSLEVLPRLAAQGLSFTARPTFVDGQFVLAYALLHTSGETMEGTYPLHNGQPQQVGSEITYARRYCLCAVTGVAPDADDDGQAAQHGQRAESNGSPSGGPTCGRCGQGLAGAAVTKVDGQFVHKDGCSTAPDVDGSPPADNGGSDDQEDADDARAVTPPAGGDAQGGVSSPATPMEQIKNIVGDSTNALGWYTLDRYATAKLNLLTPDQQAELLVTLQDDRDAVLAEGFRKAEQAAEA